MLQTIDNKHKILSLIPTTNRLLNRGIGNVFMEKFKIEIPIHIELMLW